MDAIDHRQIVANTLIKWRDSLRDLSAKCPESCSCIWCDITGSALYDAEQAVEDLCSAISQTRMGE